MYKIEVLMTILTKGALRNIRFIKIG